MAELQPNGDLLSRKFIMALLWFAGTTALAFTRVPADHVAEFWIWSMGLGLSLYGGANVLEKRVVLQNGK